MQGPDLFEYAVIRVVPRVEREEFINVGVILFCSKKKFLQFKYEVNESRLLALSPELDINEIKEHLQAFEQICLGSKQGGAIAQLDMASRFRWLTASRSTVVQASKVHPGLCGSEMEGKLQKLFEQLVL
ncbi:DUF3037 domain-containing protein [Mucilaginibacter limnophilus]|uniref:DUF3037 domain-containing protein n=1 Tax=Mucilaginibacter limnophilus TaxID=1932778 RepID=A0A3S2UKP4_9SPHI|nr:DUF3037 domain-containing protein [Mucilaginibacter limnophilus]RVU00038.1 DUF3037 domain-containing protein [Mucilaginibacter limnophilus]